MTTFSPGGPNKYRTIDRVGRQRQFRALIVSVAAAALLTTGVVGVNAESGLSLPSIQGKALTGKKFEAPADFDARHNLVIIAFLREQQELVDTWIPRMAALEDSLNSFRFYEFPVLPQMNAFTRWFIYQGMRSGVVSEAARERTVTFHLDKETFKKQLGIETENAIHLFLVGREGDVLWKTTGEWDRMKENDLRRAIQTRGITGSEVER